MSIRYGRLSLNDPLLQEVDEILGQDDVFHINRCGKQWCDFTGRETGDAATDAGHQELVLLMVGRELDELVNIGFDGLHAALHRRDGITLSLQSHALAHDGAKAARGNPCGTATVSACQVAAKDKNLILS